MKRAIIAVLVFFIGAPLAAIPLSMLSAYLSGLLGYEFDAGQSIIKSTMYLHGVLVGWLIFGRA